MPLPTEALIFVWLECDLVSRLEKVLALMESDNDAEALQALRTARILLGKDKMSFAELARGAQTRPRQRADSPSRESQSHLDPLRSELLRYRGIIEVMAKERTDLEAELEKLKKVQTHGQFLQLFQRLNERQENIDALTREIRRLKTEIFHKDRELRSLERQVKQQEKALLEAERKLRAAERRPEIEIGKPPNRETESLSPPSPKTVVQEQRGEDMLARKSSSREKARDAAERAVVRDFVRVCCLRKSSESTDWISVRILHQIFCEGHAQLLGEKRVKFARYDLFDPASLSQRRFAKLLDEALDFPGSGSSEGSQRSSKGFQLSSRLDLALYDVTVVSKFGKAGNRSRRES